MSPRARGAHAASGLQRANPRRGPPAAHWREGWWSHAQGRVSPNFGPRPAGAQVDLAVIHSISLPPGRYGGDAIERLFTNTLDWDAHPYYAQIRGVQVSAHFLIRRDGSVLQFVSCDQRAWHAGPSSWQGRDNCNDYSVGIELEGLEGEPFESAQYVRLIELLRALAARYPIGAVVGHEHIAAGRKNDPGAGFNWQQLVSGLGWPAHRFPPGVGTAA
jgi:N-acetyl-anhydromuramyl-L-alanine amidase AmpD